GGNPALHRVRREPADRTVEGIESLAPLGGVLSPERRTKGGGAHRALSPHRGDPRRAAPSGHPRARTDGFLFHPRRAYADSAAHWGYEHPPYGTPAVDRSGRLRLSRRWRDSGVAGGHRLGVR